MGHWTHLKSRSQKKRYLFISFFYTPNNEASSWYFFRLLRSISFLYNKSENKTSSISCYLDYEFMGHWTLTFDMSIYWWKAINFFLQNSLNHYFLTSITILTSIFFSSNTFCNHHFQSWDYKCYCAQDHNLLG